MRRKIPSFATDEEAESFVAEADLTEYDLSGARPVRFEFQPKTERVNMRLPAPLLQAVKMAAAKRGIPYQRLIRLAIERELGRHAP